MPEVIVKDRNLNFFGPADRIDGKPDGKVKSEYPAYYNEEHIETLKESILQKENALNLGYVADSERPQHRALLEMEKQKLEEIEGSFPRLTDQEKDAMVKVRKSIGLKIKEAMFSRSNMEKGIADAHEEARRITLPCVKLEGDEIPFVKACDVVISNDGKVTRTGAEKAWKIFGRLLGEMTDSEELRKP